MFMIILFKMRNVSDNSQRESQNAFYAPFFWSPKILSRDVKEGGRDGETAHYNTAHALCMLDN
jgi:hypothetical protein